LTEAAQALTKQLEQNSNAVSETVSTNHLNAVNGISGESEVTTSDPEPIIAETSTELGKTKNEFSKNVKGAHSAKASTSPGTNRKTNSNKTEQKPEDVGANHLNAVNNIIGESEVTMSDPESFVAETPKELGKMENKSTKKVKVAHFAKASTSLGMKRKITTEKSEQKSEKLRPQKTLVVSKSDWKSLSESTLKRKTVKELTGYLSDKVRRLSISMEYSLCLSLSLSGHCCAKEALYLSLTICIVPIGGIRELMSLVTMGKL